MKGCVSQPLATWLILACIASWHAPGCSAIQTEWLSWGGNKENWRFSDHACVDSKQLASLQSMKSLWTITTAGTVAATPGVCGGFVYYVDWKSTIAKVSLSGKTVWTVNAKTLLPGEKRVGVRTTPVFSEGCKVLFVATQWTSKAHLIALDTATGKPKYPPAVIDKQLGSRVTMSPTYFKGKILVGMASNQENNYEMLKCCDFRGSVVSVDAATGKVDWQTFMCPAGWSGCAVWGSSPAVDEMRRQVCVGTGNLYSVPPAAIQCLKSAAAGTPAQKKCVPPGTWVNSVVCLDLKAGTIKWGHQSHGVDVWGNADPKAPNVKKMFATSTFVISLDRDFAQAPIFIRGTSGNKDMLLATSKGGITWAFDAAKGKPVWMKELSLPIDKKPGSGMFGSCTNGKIYCAGLHWYSEAKGRVTCMNVTTGKKVWAQDWTAKAGVYGPLTCTQKQVFAPVLDQKGTLAVLDINTGVLLGSWNAGVSLFCGPAIVNGVMYLGAGYGNGGQPGTSLHAVALPGCTKPGPAPAPGPKGSANGIKAQKPKAEIKVDVERTITEALP